MTRTTTRLRGVIDFFGAVTAALAAWLSAGGAA